MEGLRHVHLALNGTIGSPGFPSSIPSFPFRHWHWDVFLHHGSSARMQSLEVAVRNLAARPAARHQVFAFAASAFDSHGVRFVYWQLL